MSSPPVEPSTAPFPVVVKVMLRAKNAPDFKPAGQIELPLLPARGTEIAFDQAGMSIRGRVEEIFVPPGCEEHCIATAFVAEA